MLSANNTETLLETRLVLFIRHNGKKIQAQLRIIYFIFTDGYCRKYTHKTTV